MLVRTRLIIGPALVLALGAGCSEEPEAAAEPAPTEQVAAVPEVSVQEAARLFAAGEAVPVDANHEAVRTDQGIVPGARLLSSSGTYDPASELPADHGTNLVFYCYNSDCNASDGAANRAREAGFAHVNVMRAGITGWVEAGQDVAQPTS